MYDARCTDCDATGCLLCTDLLLSSVRRSGRRDEDPPLPFDEYTRQLSRLLPFGSQSPYAFEEAETFYLKTDVTQLNQAGVNLAGSDWRQAADYKLDTTPGARDPYTLGQPPPALLYREGHFEQFLQSFNARRGLAPDGGLPAHTRSAIDSVQAAQAAGASQADLDILNRAIPWFHNLSTAYQGIALLKDESTACGQGIQRDATWLCAPMPVSHVICGHPGTIQWTSPTFFVREDQPYFRVAVSRSGGGLGRVTVRYDIRHITTTASDVTPTAPYTASQTLVFEEGMVMLSFIISINDDQEAEANEVFSLFLANPTNGATIGAQGSTQVSIEDDDAMRLQAGDCLLGGPSFLKPSLPGMAAGQPDQQLPDTVLTGVAGMPVVLHIDIRNASNQIPQNGAGAWSWPEGGVNFPGETVGQHRWLVEAWDRESQHSSQQYTQGGRDLAAQASSSWHARDDATGSARLTRNGIHRLTVARGFAVYGPALADVLRSAAAQEVGNIGGINFGALYDLASSASSGWAEMERRGRYLAVTMPYTAGPQRTSALHCKPGGLLGEYFTNTHLNGEPAITRVDFGVNFTFAGGEIAGRASDFASVRWEGGFVLGAGDELAALQDSAAGQGEVLLTFAMQTEVQDQVRLWVNHQLLFDTWGGRSTASVPTAGAKGTIRVQLHSMNRIRVEWRHMTGNAQARLLWSYDTAGVVSAGGIPPPLPGFETVPGSILYSLREAGHSPIATQIYPAVAATGVATGFGSAFSGSSLRAAMVGQPAIFHISSRDKFGNFREAASSDDTYQVQAVLLQPLYGMIETASGGLLLDQGVFAGSGIAAQQPNPAVVTNRIVYRNDIELHEVELQVSAAGVWQVRVFLLDPATSAPFELLDSPVNVTFHNAEPAAPNSLVVGKGLQSGEAGQGTPIAVRLRDRFDNLASVPNAAKRGGLRLIASNDASPSIQGDFVEWYGSDYIGEWAPKLAGNYNIQVFYGIDKLFGSPFGPAFVIPTNSSAVTSFASGTSLQNMTATEDNSFRVHIRDPFGNVRNSSNGALFVGDDTLEAQMDALSWPELPEILQSGSPAAAQVQLLTNGMVRVSSPQAVHLGDDLYEITLHPFKAGTHEMEVRLNNYTLSGSPFFVHVGPGPVVPIASVILGGNGTVGGIAGDQLSFLIQVRDGAGNDQSDTHSTDAVSSVAELQSRTSGDPTTPFGWQSLNGSVHSLGSGLFSLSYTPLLAGMYSLDARVLDQPLKNGTIPRIEVAHAEMNAANAVIFGSQTTTGASCSSPKFAGEEQKLFLLARDTYGNDATRGGDSVIMQNTWTFVNGSGSRVDGSASALAPVDVPVSAAGAANYTAHYTPTLAGRYHTEMLLAKRKSWLRTVFSDANLVGQMVMQQKVPHTAQVWSWPRGGADFTQNNGADLKWSARWTTALHANTSGAHTFILSSTDEADFSISSGFPTANSLRLSARPTNGSVSIRESSISRGQTDNLRSTGTLRSVFLTADLLAGQFYQLSLEFSTDEQHREEQMLSLRLALPGSGIESWRPRHTAQGIPKSMTANIASVPHLSADMLLAVDQTEFIKGSAHSPLVLPAPVHPGSCMAAGSGLSGATVDSDAMFSVKLSDKYGNLQLDAANSSVVAVLRWVGGVPGAEAQTPPTELEGTIHPSVQYIGDATFSVVYRPRRIGQYVLSVAVNAEEMPRAADARLQMLANHGFEVPGSPFEVTVVNSAPAAPMSSAYGEALHVNTAGVQGSFHIQTRDTAGNNLTAPVPGGVTALLRAAGRNEPQHAAVVYNGAGLYTATYVTSIAGEHLVHVSISGSPVTGSPFSVVVNHSIAHSLTSTADELVSFNLSSEYTLRGGRKWTAGMHESFGIIVRDQFGNVASRSEDDLVIRITGPAEPEATVQGLRLPYARDGSTRTQLQRALDSLGRYEVHTTLPLTGRYKVHVSLASGSSGQHGLLGEYWDNAFMEGPPLRVRVDATPVTLWSDPAAQELGLALNQTAQQLLSAIQAATPTQQQLDAAALDPVMLPADTPLPESNALSLQQLPGAVVGVSSRSASVRWSGFVKAPVFADYTLHVWVNNGAHVFVDGRLEVEAMQGPGVYTVRLSQPLRAGQLHALRIEYKQVRGPAHFAMAWSWQGQQGISSNGVRAIPPSRLFPLARPIKGSPFVLMAD